MSAAPADPAGPQLDRGAVGDQASARGVGGRGELRPARASAMSRTRRARLPEAIVARGVAEIERRQWTHCIVAGDDFGSVFATLIAATQRPRVVGLALGHACLAHRLGGERPTMNAEIADMSRRLVDIDFRAFIRQDVGIWETRPGHSVESADELVEAMTRRVPREVAIRLLDELESGIDEGGATLEPFLRELRSSAPARPARGLHRLHAARLRRRGRGLSRCSDGRHTREPVYERWFRGRAARVRGDALNRLAQETSPYLLQHKDNPVDWYPWGEEALERARARTSRSCSRSATRPATGATSWSASRSRTRRPRRT